MTRPWGQLHAATLTHRKFLLSSHEVRSAWLTLLLFSFVNPKDEDLGTRADVGATLKTLGQHRQAEKVIDRLIEIGWLDDNGTHLLLHDWDEWQPEDPTGAKRKREQRDRDLGVSCDGPVSLTDRGEERRGEENQEREESVTGPEVWYAVTLRYPQKGTPLWDWTTRLADTFGVEAFERTLRAESRTGTRQTLLSRTEAILSRQMDRAELEAERLRLAEARAAVKPVQSAPIEPTLSPEEIAAQVQEWEERHK